MMNKIIPPKYTQWTLTAIECYKLGCDCEKCDLPSILETKCVMKYAVFQLVRKFGIPAEKTERLLKENAKNREEKQ